MTEETDWQWQGFFGPMATASAAKLLADEDARAGVWVPERGQPPRAVDTAGTFGMFAVQTRAGDPIACPEGLFEADPAMVGRLVAA